MMPLRPFQPSRESYIEAFKLMRDGVLLQIIASLFIGGGLLAIIMSSIPVMIVGRGHAGWLYAGALLIGLGLVLIIGAVLALIGLYGKFLPGVEKLAEVNPDFKTSRDLVRIGYYYGMILLLVGAVTLIILVGIIVLFAAIILLFIGYIGLIMLSFNLREVEGDSLYLAAGILFILGIFLPVLSFIAWILLYIALGNSIRRHSAVQPPAPSTGLPV